MSDLILRIQEWTRSMGYSGEMPQSLNKICNPSVAFIWEQLISNVKPKQEVAHIRRNIIVHRLKQKSLMEQKEFSYPVKEIDVFLKRQTLEKKVSVLEKNIEEEETLIDGLLEKNKMTSVLIDNIKGKIKENSEKKFLLERKSKMLEDDLHKAQEVLTLARNLTPVEMEDNADGNNVTETLQKCAEKLCKLAEDIPFHTPQTGINRHLSLTTLKASKKQKRSAFSKSINVDGPISRDNKEISISRMIVSSPKDKQCGDDSLCLLSNSYLEASDEFDDLFLSKANITQTDYSLMKTSLDISHSSSNSFQEKTNYEFFEKLRDNELVKDTLKNLLYNNNRHLIIKCCEKLYQLLLGDIKNLTLEYHNKDRSNSLLDQDDLSDLYFIHIKNELEREKHLAVVKELQESVQRRKGEICAVFSSKSEDIVNERKRKFELQIEDMFLIACNNFLRQKIDSLKNCGVGNDELQLVSANVQKIKEEIILKFNHIKTLIENIHETFEQIRKNREETSSYVRCVSPYIFNLSMATCLKQEINSKEIQVFENYPLEFNRKFVNNDSKCFYRNLSDSTVPSYVDLDSDNLEMITALVNTPFNPAESVAINNLRSKIKLNVLKSLPMSRPEYEDSHSTYTSEELDRSEEYVNEIINKLNFKMNSSSVKEVLSAPSLMQEVADLWKEMPFRNFISEKRLVEGHSYKDTEKMLENLNNNF